ncbi:MAG: MFS transporter [Nitrososphaerota archaeon]|nr:MFS transporter [Aigarchaeota archaeon]MDW8076432.1 MFS transporter [Nitrososphaerota archaeon]
MSEHASFLRLLSISTFLIGLGISSGLYFIPIQAEILGASYVEIGALGFVRALPYIFLPALVGHFFAGINKAKLYLISPLMAAIFYILISIIESVPGIIAAQFLMGLSFVFYWPVGETMIASSSTAQNRVKAFAFYSVSWNAGFLLGPTIGGYVAEGFGIHAAFWLSLTILAAAIPTVLLLKPPKVVEQRNLDKNEGNEKFSLLRLSPFYGMLTIQSMVYATLLVIFPNYAWGLGISEFYVGTIFTVFSLARLLSFLVVGNTFRSQPRFAFTIASIFFAIPMLLIAYFPSLPVFYAAVAIYAATLSYFTSLLFNALTRNTPADKYGFVVGIYEGIFGLGFAFGPLLAGYVSENIGLRESFLLQAIMAFAMTCIAILSKVETNNKNKQI